MSAIMTSRQSAELDHAFERNGWTADDVKKLSGGNLLTQLLPVVRGRAEVVVKSVLTFLRRVTIPAQEVVTTSEEYFRTAGIKSMGSNFEQKMFGLEVPAVGKSALAVSRLEESSTDGPIRAELDGRELITPTQFTAFLAKNKGIKEWFLFYMEGNDGKVWAVDADWHDNLDGWRAEAGSVSRPSPWSEGDQVVSQDRN